MRLRPNSDKKSKRNSQCCFCCFWCVFLILELEFNVGREKELRGSRGGVACAAGAGVVRAQSKRGKSRPNIEFCRGLLVRIAHGRLCTYPYCRHLGLYGPTTLKFAVISYILVGNSAVDFLSGLRTVVYVLTHTADTWAYMVPQL